MFYAKIKIDAVQINPLECLFGTPLRSDMDNKFVVKFFKNQNIITMATSDFSTTLIVDQTPEVVFNAVTNVRGWWSETLEGGSAKLNDEFTYRYKDIHYSKQRLIEVIPNKRVVWLVLDSTLNFVEDKSEWNGTKISFDISQKNGKTELLFTHHGLVPEVECFDACSGGWNYYMHQSLLPLIVTGKGQPNPEWEKPKVKRETAKS